MPTLSVGNLSDSVTSSSDLHEEMTSEPGNSSVEMSVVSLKTTWIGTTLYICQAWPNVWNHQLSVVIAEDNLLL